MFLILVIFPFLFLPAWSVFKFLKLLWTSACFLVEHKFSFFLATISAELDEHLWEWGILRSGKDHSTTYKNS